MLSSANWRTLSRNRISSSVNWIRGCGAGSAVVESCDIGLIGLAVMGQNLVLNMNDYPSLLRNDGGNANHWLEVFLIGTRSNRDGIGASLKLTSEGFVEVEQAKGGMGYMSASDPRIHFGLGKRSRIESLVITWPSGQVDKLTEPPVDRIIAVKEGIGIVPRSFPKVSSR